MIQALFLDRDGVVIENQPNYVRSLEEVIFIQEAMDALRELNHSHIKIFFVTNQSAVGRGILSLETAMNIHQYILGVIHASGGRVDDSFLCPHSPQDACNCRKPKPGLFLQAAERYNLSLADCILVGDAVSDLEAAQNAGVGIRILVRTGRGADQLRLDGVSSLAPFLVFDSLIDAVTHFPPQPD